MPVEPNEFDDDLLVKARSSQTDPIVQYYIVRSDVGMTIGKVSAQIAHGAVMWTLRYQVNKKKTTSVMPSGGLPALNTSISQKWFDQSFRKVVLAGKKKDFEKIKKELWVVSVTDAGLTEVEPGTETVLVTWPMVKSRAPKCISRLQVLKPKHINAPLDEPKVSVLRKILNRIRIW